MVAYTPGRWNLPGVTLDLAALHQFLSPPPTAPDGRVWSWVGPSAYPYDEATALIGRLGLSGRLGDASRFTTDALGRLLDRLVLAQGALGREGTRYVFDTALALPLLSGTALDIALDYVRSGLVTRRGSSREDARRWSETFGPHLIKAAAELGLAGEATFARDVTVELVGRHFKDGRFEAGPTEPATYVHAHCYAVEGLVMLGGFEPVVQQATDWLAERVASDGSLPAWVGLDDERRPADVVAQAARLFLRDRARYERVLGRCLSRLGELQDPVTGGLRYDDTIPHVNVWASAFALDAVLAQGDLGPSPHRLV